MRVIPLTVFTIGPNGWQTYFRWAAGTDEAQWILYRPDGTVATVTVMAVDA